MLSFSLANDGRAIAINADDAGIDLLVAALTRLRDSGRHAHLRAPSCGGNELDEKTPFGDPAVPEVIIGHGGENP